MKRYQPYHDLLVWQAAHELVLETYKYSEKFPKQEMFGLTSQLRRAVVSIAANVVEGHGRRSKKECLYFANISVGSLRETNYFIELSGDLNYLTEEEQEKLYELSSRTGYFLFRYINGVKKRGEDQSGGKEDTCESSDRPTSDVP